MLYLPTLLGYFRALILCTILALSVDNLFLQWALLELNMLCFIPIFIARKSANSATNRLKYFVCQSRASLLFVIAIIIPTDLNLIITLLMMFKIGVPPLQRWLTSIIPTLNIPEIIILLTVQKIIPLTIVSQLNCKEVISLIVISSFLFTLSNLADTTALFKLLFISSVVNIIWTLRNLWSSWLLFFAGYTAILGGLIINLHLFSINKTSDLLAGPRIAKFILPIQFFNLGGVPPLIGFHLKLMLLAKIIAHSPMMAFLLLFSTLVVLYIYTIIFYQANCVRPPTINSKIAIASRQQTKVGVAALVATSFFYPLLI